VQSSTNTNFGKDKEIMKSWYVVQVYTGFEETVKADLQARAKEEGLEDLFGDVLVPTGKAAGALVGADLEEKREKIFPGYLLIQMEMSGDSFRLVSTTPRVTRFLGGETPMPLSGKKGPQNAPPLESGTIDFGADAHGCKPR